MKDPSITHCLIHVLAVWESLGRSPIIATPSTQQSRISRSPLPETDARLLGTWSLLQRPNTWYPKTKHICQLEGQGL